jgi:hypothetical protein
VWKSYYESEVARRLALEEELETVFKKYTQLLRQHMAGQNATPGLLHLFCVHCPKVV